MSSIQQAGKKREQTWTISEMANACSVSVPSLAKWLKVGNRADVFPPKYIVSTGIRDVPYWTTEGFEQIRKNYGR